MRTFVSDEPDPSEHSAALIQPLSPAGAGLSSERSPAQPSLFIPALAPDVLDRSRIRALMDDAAAPGRLAMLLGPPGTGKTTAAALWARRCERPVVWLDAEESAGDPWEFYADLIDELQRATGTTGLSSIIAGFEQPRPLRRMGAVLARELLRRGTDAAIVVDHAELLGDEALGLVEVLAARLSSLSWVLLAVSLDSDFILTAETKLSGAVIDSEDLELTAEEALSVLREAGIVDVNPEVLPHTASPLMIRSLIAQTRRRGGDGPVTAETLNDLQKDLAARSLRRIIAEGALTSEHRTFLLASLTQTADSELISGLLRVSPSEGRATLRRLARHGLGFLDADGILHVEENLGSGMREIAEERLQPADLAQAHRTICDWHLKHSRPADALQHADCAGDWERISLLMLLHFHELSAAAKRQAGQILSRMPCGMLGTHPWMGWFRILLLNDAPGTTLTTLQAAGETILGSLDPAAEGLHAMVVDGVKFAVHRTLGDFETSDELISGLLPQVEALRVTGVAEHALTMTVDHYLILQAVEAWLSTALRQYAASSKLFLGEFDEALALIDPITGPLFDEHGEFSWTALYSHGVKALTLAVAGRYAPCRQALEQLEEAELPPGWDESRAGIPACIARAHTALVDRRPERARAELELIMRHHGSSEWWPFVLALRTRMSFYFPEPGMIGYATSQLWSHKESPPTSRFMQVHMHCQTAVAALAAGGLPQAARHLERAKELDYPRRPGACIEYAAAMLHAGRGEWEHVRLITELALESREPTPQQEAALGACRLHAGAQLLRSGAPDAQAELLGTEFRAALFAADTSGSYFDLLLIPSSLLLPLIAEHAPERTDLAAGARGAASSPVEPVQEGSPHLTGSEKRVLDEMLRTDSRAVIAHRLYLSENTVKTHLRRIYKKLQARSRDEVLERAYAFGLLDRPHESS